jgi:hypothetical protein
VLAFLPSKGAMKQTVQRIRKNNVPVDPSSKTDLVIPEVFKFIDVFRDSTSTSKTSEGFLLADSGQNEDRILLFGTASLLKVLQSSTDWHVDGTFSVVPKLFAQLVTIHARWQNSHTTLPCLFALMPGKKESDYVRLLEMVCSRF